MTSNLTPTQIAQQALALLGKPSFLERLNNDFFPHEKRWRCERIVKDRTVTEWVSVTKEIDTIKDVLDFVEAVALVTANTEEHKALGDIKVSAYENELSYHKGTTRPATDEELRVAEEWLAANPQQAMKLAIKVPKAYNNGDTNND